ncbi:MAG: alpha/beta fold hydrolase [Anaerolineaceae bacterium]
MKTKIEKNQDKIISSDGTALAFERAGSGSALILVHGTGADHTRWTAILSRLADQFKIFSIDRRGRGASGDSVNYDIQHEYEDIATIAASLQEPVDILGHSFGAAVVLGAAPMIPNLRRLILYEPPMLREQHNPLRMDLIMRMEEALARGDREAVVLILLNEMLHVPLVAIDMMRATPAWAGQLEAAHTIPRELRSSDAYGQDLESLKAIRAQTLFLLGSESMESFRATTETLLGLLPNSQLKILPGQQHSAMLTAPDLFASEVSRFLLDSE